MAHSSKVNYAPCFHRRFGAHFQNQPISDRSATSLQADSKSGDFQTERADWTLFRTLATLPQMAGVPASRLRRLSLKELVDNALDTGAEVEVEAGDGFYIISDDGHGIDGSPQEIANLFSINRPLRSTKQWRRPQRGALGNGLRVVAGTLIASGEGATLTVETRGQCLTITPLATGGAEVEVEAGDVEVGTRITIAFGPDLPADDNALGWAYSAVDMSEGDAGYTGKTSAHWYDAAAFHELLLCSGARPVRDLIANLDGLTGAKAGQVVGKLKGRQCNSLTVTEATTLLKAARLATRAPDVKKLGVVGEDVLPELYYYVQRGVIEHGSRAPLASLPVVIEAWAEKMGNAKEFSGFVEVFINRTPSVGEELRLCLANEGDPAVFGCGLHHLLEAPKKGCWRVTLNVTTPYQPITTQGKAPDLGPLSDLIGPALGPRSAKLKRRGRRTRTRRSSRLSSPTRTGPLPPHRATGAIVPRCAKSSMRCAASQGES